VQPAVEIVIVRLGFGRYTLMNKDKIPLITEIGIRMMKTVLVAAMNAAIRPLGGR
jgi:hypothetical protein